MKFKYFLKNGDILPIEEANVSLSSIEYAYGFGVYESLRVKNRKALFISDHIERLMISAEIIGIEHNFSKEQVSGYVQKLIENIDAETYNVKVLLIGAVNSGDTTLYITCSNPLFPDKKWYRDGVSVITAEYERAFPHAKSLNMLQSYIAYKEAKKQGAYDALLINRAGHITEGTRTNFFTIKDKTTYSAPESEVLLGVTRKNVLEVALENGYKTQDAEITLDTLKDYDGAFLTGTSAKIMPIKSVGDFAYNKIPSNLRELMKLFDEFLST